MAAKLFFTLVLVIAGFSVACAQKNEGKDQEQMMKELREFKVRYIAQEIDLQDDQREKFTALYNEMSDKRNECMKAACKLELKVKKNENATEADYEAAAEAMNKAKAENAAIEKAYDDKFAEFLSPKQVYKMKAAENEFRKKMQEIRHKRGPKHGHKKTR